jgi:hypothetical protein
MKMNDWFALAITIQRLYDVEMPTGYKPSFLSCFLPSTSSVKNADKDKERCGILEDIRDHNDKMREYKKQEKAKMKKQGAGGAKKFKKILGRNRKVYKKKGNGNVLYVKVKGQEMTLKEARVLDAEHLKSKKKIILGL